MKVLGNHKISSGTNKISRDTVVEVRCQKTEKLINFRRFVREQRVAGIITVMTMTS